MPQRAQTDPRPRPRLVDSWFIQSHRGEARKQWRWPLIRPFAASQPHRRRCGLLPRPPSCGGALCASSVPVPVPVSSSPSSPPLRRPRPRPLPRPPPYAPYSTSAASPSCKEKPRYSLTRSGLARRRTRSGGNTTCCAWFRKRGAGSRRGPTSAPPSRRPSYVRVPLLTPSGDILRSRNVAPLTGFD
jgi:hypothetical protein